MKSGLEIKPLGWIALIALIGAVVYFIFYHNKPKRERVKEKA